MVGIPVFSPSAMYNSLHVSQKSSRCSQDSAVPVFLGRKTVPSLVSTSSYARPYPKKKPSPQGFRIRIHRRCFASSLTPRTA